MKRATISIICFIFLFMQSAELQARSFRERSPILKPAKEKAEVSKQESLPKEVIDELPPLDMQEVREIISDIADSWNSGTLSEYLDEGFYNKDRLLDTLAVEVPRDAVLRILNVRNLQVLRKSVERGGEETTVLRSSSVLAVVETQVEFNDPRTGFQRLPGTLEIILRIDETFTAGSDE